MLGGEIDLPIRFGAIFPYNQSIIIGLNLITLLPNTLKNNLIHLIIVLMSLIVPNK